MASPSPSPSPLPSPSPSPSRLWRPAAQKNLRNQWSYLLAAKKSWISAASDGRRHATDLINAFLSEKYMPMVDLGALKDTPNIREKACQKLIHKQNLHQKMLLSSYKEMVCAVSQMVVASKSMRTYLKSSEIGSPIIQFCRHADVSNDSGDGGSVTVFKFLSVYDFEKLAQEVVKMFVLELVLKRLIVVELISVKSKEADKSRWLNELFDGEFDEFKIMDLISDENFKLLPPKLKDVPNNSSFLELPSYSMTENVLQVYLTAWLANVNIYMGRVNEIVAIMEEEMRVKFS